MQHYEYVSDKYGNMVEGTDTLDGWKEDLISTCEANGWRMPQLRENSYGDYVDQDGDTVLTPVQEWQEV